MFPISHALSHMREHFASSFKVLSEQIDLESSDVSSVLNALAEFLLIDAVPVVASCRPILLDLVSRSLARVKTNQDLERAVTVMLPTALRFGPACLLTVVLERLRELGLSLFDRVNELTCAELRALVRSAHDLLSFSIRFASLWSWAPLLALVNHADEEVRFFAAAASALCLQMSDSERQRFSPLNANTKLRLELVQSHGGESLPSFEWDMTLASPVGDSRLVMGAADLFPSVVSVCGILLPRRKMDQEHGSAKSPSSIATSKLVYTNSAVRNLQAIALALARGRPVVVAVKQRESAKGRIRRMINLLLLPLLKG